MSQQVNKCHHIGAETEADRPMEPVSARRTSVSFFIFMAVKLKQS
jgi:hypothetical protein